MKNKKLRNEFIERLDTLSEDIHAHPLETRYDKFTMMKNTLIAEAKEAGKYEGRVAGEKEGISKGIFKGAKDKSLEIAKNMLNLNLDMKTIISATGLTATEIENLK